MIGQRVRQAGGTITITNAQLAPAESGKLALSVWFKGDATGHYVVGTPSLDTLPGKVPRHEVVMHDLDYDLATSNPLLSTYSWLRSDAMRSTFRDHAHIAVDSVLIRGRELLTSGLNRQMGDATLRARVNSVAVRGLFVTRAGIVVRGEATGTASVDVGPRCESRRWGFRWTYGGLRFSATNLLRPATSFPTRISCVPPLLPCLLSPLLHPLPLLNGR